MLMLVRFCLSTRSWFPGEPAAVPVETGETERI
jgi:hypothetical protein